MDLYFGVLKGVTFTVGALVILAILGTILLIALGTMFRKRGFIPLLLGFAKSWVQHRDRELAWHTAVATREFAGAFEVLKKAAMENQQWRGSVEPLLPWLQAAEKEGLFQCASYGHHPQRIGKSCPTCMVKEWLGVIRKAGIEISDPD